MIKAKLNAGVSGHFTFKTTNIKTGVEKVIAEFPNLILNAGLERMGSGTYLDFCRVGNGSSPPTVEQTLLDSIVASTNTEQANTIGAQTSAPYYGWRRKTFRFAAGTATGNLSEVGVGWGTTGQLFSRALILDNNGTPTTINVLAEEVLDVVYELRIYPPLEDVVIPVLDLGLSTHTVTIRAASVTEANSWGFSLGARVILTTAFQPSVFNGGIGAITGSPSGAANGVTVLTNTYSANSLVATGELSAGLNQGNLSGGITAARIYTSLGSFQIGFSPAIPKDSTRVLRINISVSWSRYAP